MDVHWCALLGRVRRVAVQAALGQKNAELEHLGRMSEETHNALEARITDLEGQLARAKAGPAPQRLGLRADGSLFDVVSRRAGRRCRSG